MKPHRPSENNRAQEAGRPRWTVCLWLVAAAAVLAGAVVGGRALRLQVAASEAGPAETPALADRDAALSRGEVLYQISCARCHGPEGQGDGEAALLGGVRPRAFATQQWRFAKTRESIERVIAHGIPGGAMPAAGASLAPGEIRALAEYVLDLARREPRPFEEKTLAGDDLLEAAGFTPAAPRAAPPLELTTHEEATTSLAAHRGRTVLVHFWGTSCGHCLAEIPQVVEMAAQLEDDGLTVLSVCADEDDPAAVERAARDLVGSRPLYVDRQGLAVARFQVQTLPAYVLVDPQGRIVGTATGARAWSVQAWKQVLQHQAENAQ